MAGLQDLHREVERQREDHHAALRGIGHCANGAAAFGSDLDMA